jgi:hypothetical protein
MKFQQPPSSVKAVYALSPIQKNKKTTTDNTFLTNGTLQLETDLANPSLPISSTQLLQLQKSYGNRAVTQLMRARIQATSKLPIMNEKTAVPLQLKRGIVNTAPKNIHHQPFVINDGEGGFYGVPYGVEVMDGNIVDFDVDPTLSYLAINVIIAQDENEEDELHFMDESDEELQYVEEQTQYEDHFTSTNEEKDFEEEIDVPRAVDMPQTQSDILPNEEIMNDSPPSAKGETGVYRIFGTGEKGKWETVHLIKQMDDSLQTSTGEPYRVLEQAYGKGSPFVSKGTATSTDAKPSEEFLSFLVGLGFTLKGDGKIQDRLHHSVVKALMDPTSRDKLIAFLQKDDNGTWYTDNIRQGSLNELILTSDSVKAVEKAGGEPGKDKYGWRDGKAYSFVDLQRDTSLPTKDFVFKETYDKDGHIFQNCHVNARMYYIDAKETIHKTVGPISPIYHLSVEKESLKFHFGKAHTMKTLVARLFELHKFYLATKSDILSVSADKRGPQIYEMRSGDKLKLNDQKHLNYFADIVEDHTNNVLKNLSDIFHSLEEVPNGVPNSPYNEPMSGMTEAPSSPNDLNYYQET